MHAHLSNFETRPDPLHAASLVLQNMSHPVTNHDNDSMLLSELAISG